MLKRLRLKFICINMLIVTIMLAVIFGLVLLFTGQIVERASERMMQSVAVEPSRWRLPDRRGEEAPMRLSFFVLEVGAGGTLKVTGGEDYNLSDEGYLRQLLDRVRASRRENGVLTEYGLRFCRVETREGERIVFADTSSEVAAVKGLMLHCAGILIVSFFAFLGVSLLLARWAVKPVERAWTQQQQFVADASHELKTPLTVILTNAELLQSPDYDEQSRAQFASSLLAMAHQMRGLVEGLLELARVDNGAVATTMCRLDLSQLVSEAVLPFEPLYFEQGLEMDCRIGADLQVKGSDAHLRQVVSILLDNAMKYSAPRGTVRVELERRGMHCMLRVSNPGEPLSPEELKDIFKRFYRGDKVRSMNHSYGLGLSIAERIVQEHHGKIWAESQNGINTFFVELPVTQR